VGSASEDSTPRAVSPFESASRAAEAAPAPFESKPVAAVGLAEPLPGATDGSLALAATADAVTAVAEPPDLDRIREAVCAALAQAGHETAANLIHQGKWTDQSGTIRVELAVRKTMLSLTVNNEAETICRKTMRAMGATQKIAFVPGENGNGTPGPARESTPLSGSAQSAALDNPLVRKTQELFKADIRSVLDLRDTH
jgi:DNA polymerase-3 subunit gamma/tau